MPEISVIVPTYNYAHFIGDCLDSIFAQTYKDFEVIVIDDGSTDDTARVLEKYKGEIRYIYQENKGLPAARNTGIKAAQGEYLAFLDSDDLWLPEKLGEQVLFLRNEADMGIIFSDASAFNEKGVIQNPTFMDYRIPTATDVPMIDVMIVEVGSSDGIYGIRHVGEPPIIPTLGAMANAIYNAVGVRLYELPMTPEAVFRALHAQDKSG